MTQWSCRCRATMRAAGPAVLHSCSSSSLPPHGSCSALCTVHRVQPLIQDALQSPGTALPPCRPRTPLQCPAVPPCRTCFADTWERAVDTAPAVLQRRSWPFIPGNPGPAGPFLSLQELQGLSWSCRQHLRHLESKEEAAEREMTPRRPAAP